MKSSLVLLSLLVLSATPRAEAMSQAIEYPSQITCIGMTKEFRFQDVDQKTEAVVYSRNTVFSSWKFKGRISPEGGVKFSAKADKMQLSGEMGDASLLITSGKPLDWVLYQHKIHFKAAYSLGLQARTSRGNVKCALNLDYLVNQLKGDSKKFVEALLAQDPNKRMTIGELTRLY